MVKIYDTASRAFKEAGTPLVYDGNLRAWKESTGLVWNEGAQAWEKRWGPKLWLYDHGECDGSKIELKFIKASRPYSGNTYGYFCGIASVEKIDLSKYAKMEVIVDGNYGTACFPTVKNGDFYFEERVNANSTPGQRVNKTIDLGGITGERYVMVGAMESTGHSVTHSVEHEKDHVRAIINVNGAVVADYKVYQIVLS